MEIAFKIRTDLLDYISYLQLATLLTPGKGLMNPVVRETMGSVIDFINYADESECIGRGLMLLNSLEPIVKGYLKQFPVKKSLKEVGAAFREIASDQKATSSYGIPFGWLDTHLDTSNIVNGYTPYQTKIGVGYHAGKYSLEESALLSDGFYFLASAKETWQYLSSLKTEALREEKDGYVSEEFYNKSLKINLNVCSLSRNSIVNLYSCIECFVNSVGYDFFLRNESSLPAPDQYTLKGSSKKGSFLSLKYKLEKFPSIINPKAKQTIFALDVVQRKNPFLDFLDEYKEIRDAAMHYSPLKQNIWRKPEEWVEKAELYSHLAIEVAQAFWRACYPQQSAPRYLSYFDYQRCYEDGLSRYESMKACFQ